MDKELQQWLQSLARRWGLEGELAQQAPLFLWRDAVGPGLAKLARPLYVEGRTLHLAVASYVAATELRLLEGKLLARLGEAQPGLRIERLKFHVLPSPVPARRMEVQEPSPEDWRAAEGDIPRGLPGELRRKLVRIAAWARARERAVLAAGGKRCPRCGVAHPGPEEVCRICALTREGEGGPPSGPMGSAA